MRRIILCVVALCAVQPMSAITFPQLVLGGGFECVLLVSNNSDFAWQGSALLSQGNDQDWFGAWAVNDTNFTGFSGFSFSLPPRASGKFVIVGDNTARAGYLEVQGEQGSSALDITVSFFYNFISADDLVDSTGVPPAPLGDRFAFTVEKGVNINTGFAWSPFVAAFPFEITLTLYDFDGIQVQQKTLSFQGHLSRFFDEIFDNVPEDFVGMVTLRSQRRIYLTVLRLESTPAGFQLTAAPPRDASNLPF